jgi:hypothetical protein
MDEQNRHFWHTQFFLALRCSQSPLFSQLNGLPALCGQKNLRVTRVHTITIQGCGAKSNFHDCVFTAAGKKVEFVAALRQQERALFGFM